MDVTAMPHNTVANEPESQRFQREVGEISESTRHLFETYSHIPKDEVVKHITAVRDKAWAIHPYPCIGRWRFLDLGLGLHRSYPDVRARLKTGEQTFLDLGCAFAQDVRRLAADGVDTTKLYGCDLRLDFLDLGYELFCDKETLKATFFEADVFAESGMLDQYEGHFDIIQASSFFHLFDREHQKRVAHRVVKLLKPQKGSLLLGRHVGSWEPRETPWRDGYGKHFRHNEGSWQELWDQVSEEAGGVKFEAKASLRERPGEVGLLSGPWMVYTVERL
ncbi:hypothetical protein LTR95_018537 [Oleoguttula sp. CCFEE 5521]